MMKNKLIIIPSFSVKLGVFMNRLLGRKFMLKMVYNIQKKKGERQSPFSMSKIIGIIIGLLPVDSII